MLEDDYVETSDAEEREELQATEFAYGKQVLLLHDDPTHSNNPLEQTQIEVRILEYPFTACNLAFRWTSDMNLFSLNYILLMVHLR
jgi:hypothetical protein